MAINDLVTTLDGMLNLVEPPTRRTLIEHVLAQIASSTYDTPSKLAAYLDVFFAGLVESQEHVERIKELLSRRDTVSEGEAMPTATRALSTAAVPPC